MKSLIDVAKEKINSNIEENKNESKLSLLELKSKWYNETEGDLNLEDGIVCEKCKNKGNISIIENGFEIMKECECMKTRKTFKRLQNCGISKETLNHYSFFNWNQNEEWQKVLLTKCREFFIAQKRDKNWFIISGQTGSGKTHICTALFQELIKSYFMNGIYMVWNDEIPKLLALRKSTYTDNQEKYEKLINEYKNTDVLYIDDLFKLDNRYKEESLSIAFEILNSRYINNKITLISTEIERNQFETLDSAIHGRCFEKTRYGDFWITLVGKEKNYRIQEEK